MTWKHMVKSMFAAAGYHLERNSDDPQQTWVGLKSLSIRSVFDIGANEGQFARLVRRQLPGAQLFCFEPLPGPYRALSDWAGKQPRVTAFNVALGEDESVAEMYVHADHSPSSSFLQSTDLSTQLYPFTSRQEKVSVPVKRLDDVVAAMCADLEPAVLVKLDVQGFEGRVIRGGRNLLRQAQACIIEVSLDTLYNGQSTFREIFLELDDLEFRYAGNLSQAYAPDARVVYIDAVFVRQGRLARSAQ